MDGAPDCTDSSDECPKNRADIFSSNYHLIGNGGFRVIVWIMATISVFGNLVSTYNNQVYYIKCILGDISLHIFIFCYFNLHKIENI